MVDAAFGEVMVTLRAGELFGEMSLFQGGLRLADMVSVSDDTVVVWDMMRQEEVSRVGERRGMMR